MKYGFVPALGTPLDSNGGLIAESYKKQINRMIDAGAKALLCMGSMGQQAFIESDECVKVAACACEAAGGRLPVFVGAMDNSIARARARVASMEHLPLTAFVLTTPYYEIDTDEQVMKYFRGVASATKHGIILYDLPSVTKYKINYGMLCQLRRDIPNLMGIKSADLNMLRKVRLNPEFEGFEIFYSGLDNFDVVYPWGLGYVLDGMPTCTPVNTEKLIAAMDNGDKAGAAEALNNIIYYRDLMLELDLWPAYSASMNMLGFEGLHAPDWVTESSEETRKILKDALIKIGEL